MSSYAGSITETTTQRPSGLTCGAPTRLMSQMSSCVGMRFGAACPAGGITQQTISSAAIEPRMDRRFMTTKLAQLAGRFRCDLPKSGEGRRETTRLKKPPKWSLIGAGPLLVAFLALMRANAVTRCLSIVPESGRPQAAAWHHEFLVDAPLDHKVLICKPNP